MSSDATMLPMTPDSLFPCRFSRRYFGVPLDSVPVWYLRLAVEWRAVREQYPEVIVYVLEHVGLEEQP